jgi:hypothetical protein
MNEVIKKTLKQRKSVYGDFKGGIHLHANIMELIRERYYQVHKHPIERVMESAIECLVNKLTRLAVSPKHADSWKDIAGYAELTYQMLEEDPDAN